MKRLMALFLALMMMFSIEVTFADESEGDVEAAMPKVASAKDGYLLSAEDGTLAMLTALNLINPLNWQGNTLNQGDFIDAVARLKGYCENYKATNDSQYVLPGDDVNAAINYAFNYNIIKSVDSIKPYEPITYGDAAKMLCDILGYKDYANAVGGYSRVKLYRDFLKKNSASENVTGLDACSMLETALNTKVLDIVGISAGGSIYDEKASLAFQSLGVYRVTGAVIATSISSVTGETASNNSLIVNGVSYLDEDCLYQCYTGLNVEMWVDEDGKIIYCYASDRDNDVEVIDVYDIGSFTQSKLTYYNNKGKDRSITYSSPIIIYNGKNITGNDYSKYKDVIFAPDDGFISVVTNSSATNRPILKITSLKSMVIESIDSDKYILYDRFDSTQSVLIDTNEGNHTLLNSENKKISFSDIAAGYFLTYEVSLDGTFVNAVMYENKIETTINSVSDDEIIANGHSYHLLPSALVRATEPIKAGAQYVLYLNPNGRIFYAEKVTQTRKKAYLLAFGPSRASVLDDVVKIKIVENAEQAEMENYPIYDLADNVKIDGKSCKSKDDKMTALGNYGRTKYPILYSLNSKGQVNKIDTPYYNSATESNESLQLLSENESLRPIGMSSWGFSYSLSAKYMARNDALILTPLSDGNVKFDKSDGTSRLLSAYSLNGAESLFADFIIFDEDANMSYELVTTLYFVTGKFNCIDENGDIFIELELSTGKSSTRYRVHKDIESTLTSIDIGDILRCYFDANNRLYQFSELYDYNSRTYVGPQATAASHPELRSAYGTILKTEDGIMLLKAYDSYEEVHPINTGNLYVVEMSRKDLIIEKINPNEIRTQEYNSTEADKIIFLASWNSPGTMYLIR